MELEYGQYQNRTHLKFSRSPGSGVSGDARSRLPETWDAEDAGRLERVAEWGEYHAANNLPHLDRFVDGYYRTAEPFDSWPKTHSS
ncbi:Cutinase [Fusarium oxysporum f. sp. albedinis]|nr:Cutinase [Fusarium oxysporum f. sp. albedinis]